MSMVREWTCIKCNGKFSPINGSRICSGCRRTACVDCGETFEFARADKERCDPCKSKHALSRASDWYSAQKDRKQVYDAKRREEKRHLYRAAAKRHRQNNPSAKNADTAARRCAKMKRTPNWSDRKRIREIYAGCPANHHVDHIIPLRGELVSGLHVPDNLQYLPAAENIRKNNHYSLEHQGRK